MHVIMRPSEDHVDPKPGGRETRQRPGNPSGQLGDAVIEFICYGGHSDHGRGENLLRRSGGIGGIGCLRRRIRAWKPGQALSVAHTSPSSPSLSSPRSLAINSESADWLSQKRLLSPISE